MQKGIPEEIGFGQSECPPSQVIDTKGVVPWLVSQVLLEQLEPIKLLLVFDLFDSVLRNAV